MTIQMCGHPHRFFIIIIITLTALLPGLTSQTVFRAYPLANDYFQKIYLVKQNNKQLYLTISCKERNALSIAISQNITFTEAPRFDVFGGDQQPKMQNDSYTFLSQCHAIVEVNKGAFVAVRRNSNQDPIFSINNVNFSSLHNTFTLNDDSVKWGLGQRFQKTFDIRDGKWTIWNRDKPWKIDEGLEHTSDQTYGHQPVYLARESNTKLYHLSYFKNTFGMLYESTKNTQELKFHVVGGDIHFILMLGQQNPEPLLQKYHNFIGKSHIPPFWSLGYHQCRWGYKSISQVEDIIARFNENNLPIDTFWSDLDYMDSKMIFTVNKNSYSPRRVRNLMQTQLLHFIPLIDVGVSTHDSIAITKGKELDVFFRSIHNDKNYYTGQVWPGQVHFVDYLHPNSTAFWEGQLERLYEQIPFSGIWLDMNQPSNFRGNQPCPQPFRIQKNEGINQMTINVLLNHYTKLNEPLYHREVHAYYGHLSTIPTHQFLAKHGRPFIISRSNSVGSGHFAGHWTGDNVADWHFLKASINDNFVFQIFGIQMVGADICGFYKDTTEQLCARWMQLGSFYTFARNHNHEEARPQQPYAFGSLLTETFKYSFKTRYALLKQLYTFIMEKEGKGSIFRPLFLQFFNDENAMHKDVVESQFLFGKNLMISPILEPKQTHRSVYFPGTNEKWYRFEINHENGEVQTKSIKSYKSQSTSSIENSLPSAPPTFLLNGHSLLTTFPENRSKKLSNLFHIFSVLKNGESKGSILAIGDYHEEQYISKCVEQGCSLHFQIKESGGGRYLLKWKYTGSKDIFSKIKIKSIVVVSDENILKTGDINVEIGDIEGNHEFEASK